MYVLSTLLYLVLAQMPATLEAVTEWPSPFGSPVGTRLRPYVYSPVDRVVIYRGKFRVGEMWVHNSAKALLDL